MKFLLISVVLAPVLLLLIPFDYMCYKCTAVETICGKSISVWNSRKQQNCQHDWYIKSTCLGLLDMEKPDTPMLQLNQFEVIDYLSGKQKEKILNCLGDKNNKLKWGALLIIKCAIYKFEFTESSFEVFKSNKLDTFDWNSWYIKYELFFNPEYDLKKAKNKAEMILELLGKIPEKRFSSFKRKFLVNIGELSRQ